MKDGIPHAVWTGTIDIAGFKLTSHVLSDGTRIYEDNAEFRGLMRTIGVEFDHGTFAIGVDEPVEAEVVK
jgi:hypothetical protein